MYLCKVSIPWQYTRNPYEIHRALWQLFSNQPAEKRSFLFRVEHQERWTNSEILLQSEKDPNTENKDIRILARRQYILNLKKGQRLRFRLRANPTKKIKASSGRIHPKKEPKKIRVPLIKEAEQRDWLERKINSFCSLEMLIIHWEVPIYFRKNKEKRTGKIQTILYDGIFIVNDPDNLMHQLKQGIGPAKAFGCGLISLAPAS
jgi:CRISPR system Cascade subunit CasE